jgi:hypothetical protein
VWGETRDVWDCTKKKKKGGKGVGTAHEMNFTASLFSRRHASPLSLSLPPKKEKGHAIEVLDVGHCVGVKKVMGGGGGNRKFFVFAFF